MHGNEEKKHFFLPQKKITEKLRVDVKAMTFHKLGKGIIEEERKKKIDVAEDDFANG